MQTTCASCKFLAHWQRTKPEVGVDLVVEHPARVLVVEDDLANRVLLGRLLERAGHTVTSAASGRAALDVATPDAFDLLLLDLGLPDMDGLEVCRRLRSQPLTADLPIILVTGRDGADDLGIGTAGGADDWIGKPYEVTQLLTTIERVLRRRQAAVDMAS
jgi:CheY-like chemotaxis protein